jgi:hypothetical protein
MFNGDGKSDLLLYHSATGTKPCGAAFLAARSEND